MKTKHRVAIEDVLANILFVLLTMTATLSLNTTFPATSLDASMHAKALDM